MKNMSDSSKSRGGKGKNARTGGKGDQGADGKSEHKGAHAAAKSGGKRAAGKASDDAAPRKGQSNPEARPKPEPRPAVIVQKRDFLGRVAEAAGLSRSQARPVVEATLEQLGQAIAAGETLALPPFGRARVARQHDTKGGEVIVVKLRRAAPSEKD